MSSLPDIHVELLAQIAPRLGLVLQTRGQLLALKREGQTYRFEAFDDFVSGSVLRAACVWLEIDPAKLAEAITADPVSG